MARSGPDISGIVPGLIGVVSGVLSWDLVRLLGERREAWDDPKYWMIGYPLMLGTAFLLGLGFPEHPWRWGLVIAAAQAVWAVLLSLAAEEVSASLWPMGLLTFALLAVPLVVAAYAGQRVRLRLPE